MFAVAVLAFEFLEVLFAAGAGAALVVADARKVRRLLVSTNNMLVVVIARVTVPVYGSMRGSGGGFEKIGLGE